MSVSVKFRKTMFPFVREIEVNDSPCGLVFAMPETLDAISDMIQQRRESLITPSGLEALLYWRDTCIARNMPTRDRYMLVYRRRGMQIVGYWHTLNDIRRYIKTDIMTHPVRFPQ